MKIFIYGDSNAWGYENGYRMPLDKAWPGILSKKLGSSYEVYNESMPGRLAGDEDLDYELKGKALFKDKFNKYSDIDIVIIALGTNDLQVFYEKNSSQIIDDLLWYNKVVKEVNRNIKVYYLLPSNFDYIDFAFDDESILKREEINKYFKEHKEYNSIIPKDVFLTDGVHFDYDSHKYIASLVYNEIFISK